MTRHGTGNMSTTDTGPDLSLSARLVSALFFRRTELGYLKKITEFQQKFQKKFRSVLLHFGIKSEQSIWVIFC